MFGTRTRQLAGLDISSSSAKMLELSSSGSGNYRVERYAIESIPKDAIADGNIVNLETVSDALKRLARKMGSGTKNVALALPVSAVITKKIYLPEGLREEDMEVQVESEASQYIPFPLEEVNLDFQILGPAANSAGDVEVLIAASRKEKVEDRVAVIEAAGLKAVIVDVENFAAEAAFPFIAEQFPNSGRGRVIALVDIGAVSMHVTMLRDGVQIYSREQSIGGNQLTQDIARRYGMSQEEAENAKKAGSLPEDFQFELMQPFLDSVALEVSRALQFFFTSTQYNEVQHIVLCGGCAVMPGLRAAVNSRTQVETVIANPFVNMAVSSSLRSRNLENDAPSLMVACGLALRKFES